MLQEIPESVWRRCKYVAASTDMSVIQEFKAFVAKGNVVDLAVGVIIGAAFAKIVDSLAKDIIMPAIGMIGGTPDFSSIAIGAHQVMKDGHPLFAPNGRPLLEGGIMIGNFLNAVIAFLILAAIVFFVLVKPMNHLLAKMRKPVDLLTTATPEDIVLLREIRDALQRSSAS
jgi:large conductance mechanosensitive channel